MEKNKTAYLPYVRLVVAEEELLLLPEKVIFWKKQKIMLIADLHLGKAGHFRKAGIPVTAKVHEQDMLVLEKLVQDWQPREVIFLGDLFHSSFNTEWEMLENWMQIHASISFTLVMGNHDILPQQVYNSSSLKIKEDKIEIFPFLLTHHPPQPGAPADRLYRLCGHVHPAVQLTGAAQQQLRFPCFYFGLHYAVLPAFGKFTGFHKIRPKTGERVFGILPGRVIPLGHY